MSHINLKVKGVMRSIKQHRTIAISTGHTLLQGHWNQRKQYYDVGGNLLIIDFK